MNIYIVSFFIPRDLHSCVGGSNSMFFFDIKGGERNRSTAVNGTNVVLQGVDYIALPPIDVYYIALIATTDEFI